MIVARIVDLSAQWWTNISSRVQNASSGKTELMSDSYCYKHDPEVRISLRRGCPECRKKKL